ncbi:hypothetical protein AOQ72_16400 [Bradyrhizobium yuanmingense]|uniref:Uncharacterized protein n=1 Tax=Bradyrhizobium yuanmingense TaxID=108015 RepID=A0A0R3CMF0_9BRAD|nr:hypothetical protein AOQ72_16400 [Bradyrhizobium yuanmingense]
MIGRLWFDQKETRVLAELPGATLRVERFVEILIRMQGRLREPKVSRMMTRLQNVGAAMLGGCLIVAAFGAFFAFVAALAELPSVDVTDVLRPMIDK